jgi:hypothetical protein
MYICGEVFKISRYIHYSTIMTMIIINDPLRLLNLNTLAIYLMLTPDEKALYGDKLKDLNRYSSLTKGIFHFDVVEKGMVPSLKLPDKLYHNMYHYNVMVRLVNFIHGTFCYGMEEIDLTGDKSSIVEQLEKFVKDVCEENINLLDILNHRGSHPSQESILYFREHNIVKELFDAVLNGEPVDKENGKSTFEIVSHSTDKKTSLGIVKFASSGRPEVLDSKTERELRQNIKPESHPQINITVKKCKTGKKRKDGSAKEKTGVELNIDGNIIPVLFDSTDQTFLYIINLMAIKEGRRIGRTRFLPVAPSDNLNVVVGQRRNVLISWLHDRYGALSFSKDFEKWYNGVKNDSHRLDVAISGIKRTLWEKLEDKFKDAFYYCVLRNEDSIYKIRMDKENISIDPEIMEAILRNQKKP